MCSRRSLRRLSWFLCISRKAVATGFHEDSTEQEVEQLLRETIAEIGMLAENVKIKCTAKPITHAFIHFNDERNKYVRSANMLRKELRGRTKNIAINGCRGKISPKKVRLHQMLHSHET